MLQKTAFTEEQKNVVRVFDVINYIARDSDGGLWGFANKPYKNKFYWELDYPSFYCNLDKLTSIDFPQIKWEDKEPTSREEILGEVGTIEEMAKAMSDFVLEDSAKCDIELSKHLIAKGYRKQSDTAREIVKRLKELLHKHEHRSQTDGVSFYQMNAESFCEEINELAAKYNVEV